MNNLEMQPMDQVPRNGLGHQPMAAIEPIKPRVDPIPAPAAAAPEEAPEDAPAVIECGPRGQKPGWGRRQPRPEFTYNDPKTDYSGKDVFGRISKGRYSDQCIDVITGKFVPLQVQCTDDVLDGEGGATWERQRIQSVGPLTLRLAQWPFAGIADARLLLNKIQKSPMECVKFLAKSFALIPPMILLGTISRPLSGKTRNFGRYDPVPYRYYGRAKKSRNVKDDGLSERNLNGESLLRKPAERALLPRRLCCVHDKPVPWFDEDSGQEVLDYPSTDVGQWMEKTEEPCPHYLFVAYAAKQFNGLHGHAKLHQLARAAAEEAKLEWYWVSDRCVSKKEVERTLDIWRMSDVIRGCQTLVVALDIAKPDIAKPDIAEPDIAEPNIAEPDIAEPNIAEPDIAEPNIAEPNIAEPNIAKPNIAEPNIAEPNIAEPYRTVEDALGDWAGSIWTLPELILCPGREFRTYYYKLETALGSMRVQNSVISKNQFAARCLKTDEDRYNVRRLVDHSLGNLLLSDLELTTVALHCFSSRTAGTDPHVKDPSNGMFLHGDYSYALMGLLGRRPNINQTDTAFLAFARLSLENYNDRLFERFICLMPADHKQHWYNTQDAYGAQLWDIEPSIQVAGIGEYRENQEDLSLDAVLEKEYFLASESDDTKDGQQMEPKPDDAHHGDSRDGEAGPAEPANAHHGANGYGEAGPVKHADSHHGESRDGEAGPAEPANAHHGANGYGEAGPAVNVPGDAPAPRPVMSHSKLHEEDVVILDGCFAATVHWDRFHRVWHARRLTTKRRVLQWALRLAIIPFIAGVVLVSLAPPPMPIDPATTPHQPASDTAVMVACGAFLLIYSIIVWLAAPIIIRSVHGGKLWDTQAWFFGFEGYLPIDQIEAKIFGVCNGRLTWSPYASSPLSYSNIQQGPWVVPQDLGDNAGTKTLLETARHAKPGDMRVFTLVDTYSMTVTLFEARRPPEALLVCGSEGGMQRALGCSFEWTTSTFYKETVLRLETRVLGRMERIRRVRFGIRRMEKEAAEPMVG